MINVVAISRNGNILCNNNPEISNFLDMDESEEKVISRAGEMLREIMEGVSGIKTNYFLGGIHIEKLQKLENKRQIPLQLARVDSRPNTPTYFALQNKRIITQYAEKFAGGMQKFFGQKNSEIKQQEKLEEKQEEDKLYVVLLSRKAEHKMIDAKGIKEVPLEEIKRQIEERTPMSQDFRNVFDNKVSYGLITELSETLTKQYEKRQAVPVDQMQK